MLLGVKCWLIVVILHVSLPNGEGGYVITTPRRWTSGASSQVCVSFTNKEKSATPSSDILKVEITADDVASSSADTTQGNEKVLTKKDIVVIKEAGNHCAEIQLPETVHSTGRINISGSLEGSSVNYSKPISIATDVAQTYVQTDKFLYKPNQVVQFRILTVIGPKLQISLEPYEEIWTENPSSSRIAQWLNVPNEKGLIHMKFQLSDEPEEGTYKIKVRTPYGKIVTRTFKVEEYVLPRYKVNIKPPKYVLGTTTEYEFKVCAKYTFGQPVKGNVTLTLDNGGWGNYKKKIVKQSGISGCKKIKFDSNDLNLNDDDYYTYSLKATAVVAEEGTGVELDAESASVDVSRTAVTFQDISVQKYLKPELPYVAEIKVSLPGDTPATGEPVSVCSGNICKNMTTTTNGVLKFVVPPHLKDSISIKALNYPHIKSNNSWRSIMYESSFYIHLKEYHSPSNSSLVIALTDDKVQCTGEQMKFEVPVRYSAVDLESALVTTEVISRGQVIFSAAEQQLLNVPNDLHIDPDLLLEPLKDPVTKQAVRGTFTVPVSISPFASPEAKLIVWYARPDGEVVSDARKIDVTDCLLNNVNLTWSAEKVQPGDGATLTLTAAPLSLCSLGVVDKSVQLLSSKNNDMTIRSLLEVAERASVQEYEHRQVDDYEYCRKQEKRNESEIPAPPVLPPVALPAEIRKKRDAENEDDAVFNKMLRRVKRSFMPFWPFYSDDVDALHMFDNAGLYVFSDLTLETRPCRRRPVYFPSYYPTVTTQVFTSVFPTTSTTASAILATATATVPPLAPQSESSQQERSYFPETFLWQLSHMSDTGSAQEAVTLPDTVTEWVGSAVCVHPTQGVGISEPSSITTFRDFFADLTLPPSVKRGETFPVKISVFNYLQEALPVKVILEPSSDYDILADVGNELSSGERSSCIPSEDKTVYSIRIRPKEIGDVNITVRALVDINSLDTCGVSTGKVRTDVLIKPIRVEIEGFPKEKTWSKFICTSEIEANEDSFEPWKIETPPSIIEDSARGYVTAVGDLMGPTIEHLGSLVKMPYGCGEQNMLNFAPNIFVMQYLDASGENTADIAGNAVTYMKKGYQRELNYKHKDGSYSAFGESDESGSTWLTAFVLKSFAQARDYIQVDNADLSISKDWLKSKQLENGCFESVGKVLHKGMKGGIGETESPSLLTSFVLIALMEAGEDPVDKATREALFCLNADKDTSNPYSLAVKAYALALAKSPDTAQTLNTLLSLATEKSASLYWELPDSAGSSKGVGLETAGYAVLALLTADPTKYMINATKIVKWMNSKRNGQGGFISTQDTIVALQALAIFERNMKYEEPDLTLLVTMDKVESQFIVNSKNKLLEQRTAIPSFPAVVTLDAAGTGCVLAQAVLRYNVPEPDASEAFGLTVEASTEPDKACKTKRVKACVKYLLPDLKSNMGIIEVNLVSGYIPEKADLKQIVGYGTGLYKRYEVDGSTVSFYIDEFSSQELCVSFRIIREVDVENAKPGSVKVYDYYKPEYFVTAKYELPPNTDCKDEKNSLTGLEEEIIVGEIETLDTTLSPERDEAVLGEFVDALDEAIP